MAGNRQHILPRFLPKGFASRIDGNKIFTWVYRKGTKPFQTTIENVSVEKHFYGKQGGLSADDEITKLETGYAYLIDEIRNAQDSTEISDPKLTEFIAHVVVRTKHVREFFRNSADYMIGQVETYLAEPANFSRLLLRNPDLIREELGKLLNGFNLPSEQKAILVGLVEHLGPMIVDEQMPEVQTMLHDLMVQVKPHIANAVNEGHIKALASTPAPEPRSENYRTLKWFVKQRYRPIKPIQVSRTCGLWLTSKRCPISRSKLMRRRSTEVTIRSGPGCSTFTLTMKSGLRGTTTSGATSRQRSR